MHAGSNNELPLLRTYGRGTESPGTLRIPAVLHVDTAGSEAGTYVQYRAAHRVLLKSQRSTQLGDLLRRKRGRGRGREKRDQGRGVHLSTDIDVQRRGVGRRAYRFLGEVRRRAPRLWAVLRWRLISHAGSTHVPVIGNLLASRSGGRADPGAIPAQERKYERIARDTRGVDGGG